MVCRRSHRITDAVQAGFLSYIGKGAVPVVAEEPVRVTGIAFFKGRDGRAIGKEDVQQTVVVVVEQRYSASHGFKRVPLRTDAVLELELDLRLFDDVLELDRRCGLHHRIRGPFGGSYSALPRYLMGRGQRGLGRQAGDAPQQAKGQFSSQNSGGGSSRICACNTPGGLPVGRGRCLRGFCFIAIQIKGLESTGSRQMRPVLSPSPVLRVELKVRDWRRGRPTKDTSLTARGAKSGFSAKRATQQARRSIAPPRNEPAHTNSPNP